MITPELISYIRGELTKGRAREEIRAGLVREGGWSEADLIEAFQMVIPIQDATEKTPLQQTPSPSSPSLSPLSSSLSSLTPSLSSISSFSSSKLSSFPLRKIMTIFGIIVVIGGVGAAVWFYRLPLKNLWNSGIDKAKEFSASFFKPSAPADTEAPAVTPVAPNPISTPVQPNIVSVKDCGVGVAPDLKKPATYQNDAVLTCLGNSALLCQDARAVLKNALFPTIVQIVSAEGNCSLKLSYAEDSVLTDATGAKLAGQYVSCPLSIVKAVDETETTSSFSAPSTDNLSKYASQIYFYGTLGLFVENNLDQNRIRALGCSGPYIDSVIASFKKMQEKKPQ